MKIIQSIFLGILAALGALVLEVAFSVLGGRALENNFPDTYWAIFFLAALEELVKLVIIYKKFYLDEEAKNIFKNALSLAVGFALTETFFLFPYLYSTGFQKLDVFHISGIFFVHSATALSAAYFISRRPYEIYLKLAVILIANALIHSLYNLMILGRL